MNKISSFFLGATHRQVFLLIFGSAAIGQIIALIALAAQGGRGYGIALPFVVLALLLIVISFFGWFWSVGLYLNSLAPPSLRTRTFAFRAALAYPAAYLFFFFLVVDFQSTNLPPFSVIIPLHLLAMVCMFYALFFTAKMLVTAESGRHPSFYDYAGPFFLIWFFPVGIWFVQPRINRLFVNTKRPNKSGEGTA